MSIIGIIAVLYLTYYCTKWLSTKSSIALKSKYMNVRDRLMLGQNSFIAIVEIDSKHYLIGITEKDIKILKELDNFQPLPDDVESGSKFINILNKYKRTVDAGNNNDKDI